MPSETDILLDKLANEKPGLIADCARKYIGTGIEGHQYLVEIYWQMTQSKGADLGTFSEQLVNDFHTYFNRDLKTKQP